MTKGNVGSLLVFDPTKAGSATGPASAPADAVVGIVTERGEFGKKRGRGCLRGVVLAHTPALA